MAYNKEIYEALMPFAVSVETGEDAMKVFADTIQVIVPNTTFHFKSAPIAVRLDALNAMAYILQTAMETATNQLLKHDMPADEAPLQ